MTFLQFQEGATLPNTYAFAFVENREGKDHIQVRMFLAGEVKQISVDETEPSARLLSMRTIVKELDKFLWMLKICSLSTILREYAALRSVGSLPFKDLILSAAERDAYPEDRAWKIPRALMEFLESNHNTSQLEAIRAGLSRKTFVLIQVRLVFYQFLFCVFQFKSCISHFLVVFIGSKIAFACLIVNKTFGSLLKKRIFEILCK
uniref:Uncharacterized protein n=1 Tax=Nelumbo nucifera TaxID=4432 RepID=A0A822ZV47_NELNU|nr:TPA_asm: hypothetical protein HUJ06_018694 [Nelumbo nucifera]